MNINVAIITNDKIKKNETVVNILKDSFDKVSLSYEILNINELKSGYDFVCAIGGDGTILKASRFYARTETPVMGINFGRLGFLSLVTPEEAHCLGEVIKNKTYIIKERMMLKSGKYTALNDFVIKGHSHVRTSKFNLYINNSLVSDYIADGIIVATPTGSTAYGLSAGGPILYPSLNSMVIVPICAHTMTARPLVVPAEEKISVVSVDEMLDVSCDGQENIHEIKEFVIEQSEYRAKLAFPKDDNFYSVLQNKLHWGISPVSQN